MLYLYIILVFYTLLCSTRELARGPRPYYSHQKWVRQILTLVFIILVFMSTFRPNTLPDYEEYVRIFTLDELSDVRYEIGDVIVIRTIRLFTNNPLVFFFLFGLVGIGMKLYLIKRYSPSVFLSTTVYLTGFFILLDMIQVRNSIAISFYLFAIIYRWKCDWKKFWLFATLSFMFHYSAIVVFALAFLHPQKRLNLYKWAIPISYFMAIVMKLTLGHLAGGLGGAYAALFAQMENDVDSKINLFNSVAIMRIIIFYVIFYCHDEIALKYPQVTLMLKVYAVAICSFPLLSDFPAISGRLNHFLSAVEILLIPSMIYITSIKRALPRLLIYAYTIGCVIIFYFSDNNKL